MRIFTTLILSITFLTSCSKEDDTTTNPITPTVFTPNDIVVGNNLMQVEFSDDSRSMTWIEPSGGVQKVY